MAKLGEICAFQSGGTPSKNKLEYFGGEIPWISTTALNGGKINETDAVAWITPKAIRESAAKIVPANSIMIGTRVGIGKVAINTVEMSTSQDVISLINIDEDKWYKPYLCKLLLSKKDYFNSQARGATIKGIKIDIVANIDVPEIDYATQRKIAETLSKVDELIAFRDQQLTKLDELVKARFVEMFGEPIGNPMGWPVNHLVEISQLITNGNTPKGGSENYVETGIAFLRSQNVWRNRIDLNDVVYIDEDTHRAMKKSSVCHNDILITKTGRINTENSSLGRAALFQGKDNSANINGHVYLVRLKEGVNPRFVVTILTGEAYRKYIRKVCVGGIDKRQINLEQVEEFPIIKPPLLMQNDFATFVERVDQQKQTIQQSLEKLELMKKALMQEYFG